MTEPVYLDEMELQMDVFERGRILKTVPHDAWEIIYATIHEQVEGVNRQVRKLPPGDPSIVAAQASLYALSSFEENFKQGMEEAMTFATHPTPEFKQYLYGVRESMDVQKQMEKASTPGLN